MFIINFVKQHINNGSFLLREYISLFLNLLKLEYPQAFLSRIFTREFKDSIGPLDRRLL